MFPGVVWGAEGDISIFEVGEEFVEGGIALGPSVEEKNVCGLNLWLLAVLDVG